MEDECSLPLDCKGLANLRVVDLKQELEKRGLSKSGSKKDLVKRLKQQLEFEKLSRERKSSGDYDLKLELDADIEQNEFVQQYLAQQQKRKEEKRLELEAVQKQKEEKLGESSEEHLTEDENPIHEPTVTSEDENYKTKCQTEKSANVQGKEKSDIIHDTNAKTLAKDYPSSALETEHVNKTIPESPPNILESIEEKENLSLSSFCEKENNSKNSTCSIAINKENASSSEDESSVKECKLSASTNFSLQSEDSKIKKSPSHSVSGTGKECISDTEICSFFVPETECPLSLPCFSDTGNNNENNTCSVDINKDNLSSSGYEPSIKENELSCFTSQSLQSGDSEVNKSPSHSFSVPEAECRETVIKASMDSSEQKNTDVNNSDKNIVLTESHEVVSKVSEEYREEEDLERSDDASSSNKNMFTKCCEKGVKDSEEQGNINDTNSSDANILLECREAKTKVLGDAKECENQKITEDAYITVKSIKCTECPESAVKDSQNLQGQKNQENINYNKTDINIKVNKCSESAVIVSEHYSVQEKVDDTNNVDKNIVLAESHKTEIELSDESGKQENQKKTNNADDSGTKTVLTVYHKSITKISENAKEEKNLDSSKNSDSKLVLSEVVTKVEDEENSCRSVIDVTNSKVSESTESSEHPVGILDMFADQRKQLLMVPDPISSEKSSRDFESSCRQNITSIMESTQCTSVPYSLSDIQLPESPGNHSAKSSKSGKSEGNSSKPNSVSEEEAEKNPDLDSKVQPNGVPASEAVDSHKDEASSEPEAKESSKRSPPKIHDKKESNINRQSENSDKSESSGAESDRNESYSAKRKHSKYKDTSRQGKLDKGKSSSREPDRNVSHSDKRKQSKYKSTSRQGKLDRSESSGRESDRNESHSDKRKLDRSKSSSRESDRNESRSDKRKLDRSKSSSRESDRNESRSDKRKLDRSKSSCRESDRNESRSDKRKLSKDTSKQGKLDRSESSGRESDRNESRGDKRKLSKNTLKQVQSVRSESSGRESDKNESQGDKKRQSKYKNTTRQGKSDRSESSGRESDRNESCGDKRKISKDTSKQGKLDRSESSGRESDRNESCGDKRKLSKDTSKQGKLDRSESSDRESDRIESHGDKRELSKDISKQGKSVRSESSGRESDRNESHVDKRKLSKDSSSNVAADPEEQSKDSSSKRQKSVSPQHSADSDNSKSSDSDKHSHRDSKHKPRDKCRKRGRRSRSQSSSSSSRSTDSSPKHRHPKKSVVTKIKNFRETDDINQISIQSSDSKEVSHKNESICEEKVSVPSTPKKRLKIKRDNVSVEIKSSNIETVDKAASNSVENTSDSHTEKLESKSSKPETTGPKDAFSEEITYVPRKLSLSSRKLSRKSSEDPDQKTKKGKWESFANSQKTSQMISISTDSLKNWFPDFKLISEPTTPMEFEPDEHSLPAGEEKNSDLSHMDLPEGNDSAVRHSSTSQMEVEEGEAEEPSYDEASEQGPVSKIIFIQNLVRPFTLNQLKDLLKQSGKIVEEYFWIDKIKSKCFVMYETEKEAAKARNALNNTRWPPSNPKILSVEFSNEEELENHKRGNDVPPKPVLDQPSVESHESSDHRIHQSPEEQKRKDRDRRKDRERSKPQPPIREWDKDKIMQESPEREHSSKEEKSRSAERKEKKESKKRPNEETPAKLLDDLFMKTKSPPCIYWLPLTEEQAKAKEEAKNMRKMEREKRTQQKEQEEAERRNKSGRSSRRSREKENRKSSTRSRSPVSRRR